MLNYPLSLSWVETQLTLIAHLGRASTNPVIHLAIHTKENTIMKMKTFQGTEDIFYNYLFVFANINHCNIKQIYNYYK